jgi:hypothetical protein
MRREPKKFENHLPRSYVITSGKINERYVGKDKE